jgi:uncharacterized membrane protein
MYETESNPVQPVSLGRGVAMAGYWSTGTTWLLALIVLLLLVGAFWWMGRYMTRSNQVARNAPTTNTAEPMTSF